MRYSRRSFQLRYRGFRSQGGCYFARQVPSPKMILCAPTAMIPSKSSKIFEQLWLMS